MVKGRRDKIAILESVRTKQTPEEIFINKATTPEGAEDSCIKILAYKKMNYTVLLKIAIEKNKTLINKIEKSLEKRV